MTGETLMAKLDEAELVKYDPDGYCLAWFGGESTGVHVYDASGTEVGYWQIGTLNGERLTTAEVRQSMLDHMTTGEPYPA